MGTGDIRQVLAQIYSQGVCRVLLCWPIGVGMKEPCLEAWFDLELLGRWFLGLRGSMPGESARLHETHRFFHLEFNQSLGNGPNNDPTSWRKPCPLQPPPSKPNLR